MWCHKGDTWCHWLSLPTMNTRQWLFRLVKEMFDYVGRSADRHSTYTLSSIYVLLDIVIYIYKWYIILPIRVCLVVKIGIMFIPLYCHGLNKTCPSFIPPDFVQISLTTCWHGVGVVGDRWTRGDCETAPGAVCRIIKFHNYINGRLQWLIDLNVVS